MNSVLLQNTRKQLQEKSNGITPDTPNYTAFIRLVNFVLIKEYLKKRFLYWFL